MDKYVVAPPAGSTQNSVGAEDRPWHEGHFDTLKLGGGDVASYLAESTGYGIVSGCEPSISGLTVTVGAGVVHLADGTRKEIAETSVKLDNADSTNPRIDLVYITSAGVVAKVTGTAAASPSAPALPTSGISVAQVSVAAGASTGTVNRVQTITPNLANYGIVNVKDFGAKGDGVTDDTAAIQAAISTAANGTLIIPQGDYVINNFIDGGAVNAVIDNGTYVNLRPFFAENTGLPDLEKCSYIQGMDGDYVPRTDDDNTMTLQGFTYDSNREKVIAASVYGYDYQMLYKFTPTFDAGGVIASLTLDTSVKHTDLFHANSMTYCDMTDKVYVVLNGGSSDNQHVAVLNPSSLATETTIAFTHEIDHIAYDKTNHVFVLEKATFVAPITYTYYVYDTNFNLLETTTINADNVGSGRNSICCDKGVIIGATLHDFFEVDLFGNIKSVKSFAQSFGEMWEPEDFEIINGHIYFQSFYMNKFTLWLYDDKYSKVKDDISVNPLRFVKPTAKCVPVFDTDGSATRVDYLTFMHIIGLGDFGGDVIPADANWDDLKGIYTARDINGFTQNNSNYPSTAYQFGVLLSFQGKNGSGIQIYVENSHPASDIYVRIKYWNNTSWREWFKVSTTIIS